MADYWSIFCRRQRVLLFNALVKGEPLYWGWGNLDSRNRNTPVSYCAKHVSISWTV